MNGLFTVKLCFLKTLFKNELDVYKRIQYRKSSCLYPFYYYSTNHFTLYFDPNYFLFLLRCTWEKIHAQTPYLPFIRAMLIDQHNYFCNHFGKRTAKYRSMLYVFMCHCKHSDFLQWLWSTNSLTSKYLICLVEEILETHRRAVKYFFRFC